ncbi:GPANK1 family protein [Megaselia abdita]
MDPNYIPQAGQYIRLKRFIKAKEASHEMEEEPRKLPNKLKIKESGEEIRTFYETLTSEEIPTHSKALLTPPATPSTSKPRNKEKKLKKSFEKAKFFKLATENDLEGLRELTLSEEDINSTDDYGWTALMMASCENASETVKFLLDLGAKTDIADKKGHTALSLAQQKGFRNIIDLLDNDSSEEDEKVFEKTMKRPKPEKFFCEECNEEIKETKRKHFSSIVHQFNRKLEERPYRFQIPSENRGLKLMVKQGWDKQSGLGPTNSGHLFPIKTTIRKPRSGVGIKQTPARVTHFKPFDLNAIKYREPSRGKNRSEMAREKRRDRRLDRKLRKELS